MRPVPLSRGGPLLSGALGPWAPVSLFRSALQFPGAYPGRGLTLVRLWGRGSPPVERCQPGRAGGALSGPGPAVERCQPDLLLYPRFSGWVVPSGSGLQFGWCLVLGPAAGVDPVVRFVRVRCWCVRSALPGDIFSLRPEMWEGEGWTSRGSRVKRPFRGVVDHGHTKLPFPVLRSI